MKIESEEQFQEYSNKIALLLEKEIEPGSQEEDDLDYLVALIVEYLLRVRNEQEEAFNEVVKALDKPPEPNERLKETMNKKAIWEE